MRTHAWVVTALAFALAGCVGSAAPSSDVPASGNDATPASARTPTPQPVATADPTVVVTGSPPPSLSLDSLERVELADVHATGVCDPAQAQFDPTAGEATIFCSDSLATAIAAVSTMTHDAPVRLYFQRPPCRATPCSDDELSTATVTVWTARAAYAVRLDSRLQSVIGPLAIDGIGIWPPTSNSAPPVVKRPAVKEAPAAVRGREPYPYCGRAEFGEPPAVEACFRAAVLDGRAAEMIQKVYGTEGGSILWIYRFEGTGRLVRFEHNQAVNGLDGTTDDSWSRVEGAMVLGITPSAWDFDPWDRTTRKL